MKTSIWMGNSYRNIDPQERVQSFKRLKSFCAANLLPHCILKMQGGYYKIEGEGKPMTFIATALYKVSFQDIYDLFNPKNQ